MPKSNKKLEGSLVDKYLDYQDKYEKKYGKDTTLVIMQVGNFFETYATKKRGFDLTKLSRILNITLTRRDKKRGGEITIKNPQLVGFNLSCIKKNLDLLIAHNFTVIVIEETTRAPNPIRSVTGIYSPSTYIESPVTSDSIYLLSLFIQEEKQLQGKSLLCFGISALDLTTGANFVHESCSTQDDLNLALDETNTFIKSHPPKEIIISYQFKKNSKYDLNFILRYLEIENLHIHTLKKLPNTYFKIGFQNDFFARLFPDSGMLSPLENLDIENCQYVTISLIMLLDFAYQHNDQIVKFIKIPEKFQGNTYLTLCNDAIQKLSIFNTTNSNLGIRSLFDVINHTSTIIGKRFLKKTLLRPFSSEKQILKRYKYIEQLLNNDLYLDVEIHLRGIIDLERFQRKLMLSLLGPTELYSLYESYDVLCELFRLIESTEMKNILPSKDNQESLRNFIKEFDNIFIIEELHKYTVNDITGPFFVKGVYEDLDELHSKLKYNMNLLENIRQKLESFVDDKKSKLRKVHLKRNDQDGYYYELTKIRYGQIKKNTKSLKKIKIDNTLSLEIDSFKIRILKDKVKISIGELNDNSNNAIVLNEKIASLSKKYYLKTLLMLGKKYEKTFDILTSFVGLIDFLKSGAKCAKKYNYCKPKIIKSKNSFISCKSLRHPIIERIIDTEYIPHDIQLNKKENNKSKTDYKDPVSGMLIYGINSTGKSSLMKAVGLSIIMAQAGLYVPATEYKFKPYTSLLTRISASDDLFKGLSSFALEMLDLKAILQRASSTTLVIGDEICRGTENVSATALVASTVIELSKSKASFIFASHLHKIPKLKQIKKY